MIDEKKLKREDLCTICNSADCTNCFSDEDFRKWIDEQPKVGEWIPVSERLPEEARAVEVTMYDGNRAIGHFNNRLDTWFDSINGGFIDVIAWKEPSEPWEEEEE